MSAQEDSIPQADGLVRFTGPVWLPPAYRFMIEHDTHAPGSVDRQLVLGMVRLCAETADRLYSGFTPLEISCRRGTRPGLESALTRACGEAGSDEDRVAGIAHFTAGLGARAPEGLDAIVFGGTEEEIIARGSDWCTDVARVACTLAQVAGFPARIVNLFDLDRAYSGHVIVEVHRCGRWGAVDSSTGVIYRHGDGTPASVWELVSDPALVEAHHGLPGAFYTSAGQFRAAAIANYFCWRSAEYDYTTSQLNPYYRAILEMSARSWPGGLRWLHGEDA